MAVGNRCPLEPAVEYGGNTTGQDLARVQIPARLGDAGKTQSGFRLRRLPAPELSLLVARYAAPPQYIYRMTVVLVKPTRKEVRKDVKAMRTASAKILQSRETARGFLQKNGYITKSGILTKGG